MLYEEAKKDMIVVAGRPNGEKTLCKIVKPNFKSAKLVTLEARGRYPAGGIFNTAYSLIRPATAQEMNKIPTIVSPVRAKIPAHNPVSLVQSAADHNILMAIEQTYAALSPENVSCDGEITGGRLRERYHKLTTRLESLFVALGRRVTEQEAYDYISSNKNVENRIGS